jgi:hypothetical protein
MAAHTNKGEQMTKKILTTALIASTMTLMAEGSMTAEKKEIMMEGVKYIKILGKELKTNVGSRLKKDPTGLKAVTFCSENAKEVAKKVFADFPAHVKVRRTALKYRNPDNKPDATDTKTMEQIVAAMKAGTFNKKPVVVDMGDNHVHVYAALMVEKACTKCHGDTAKMNPEVRKVIQKKYPKDLATGFKEDDFRGVAVAEITTKK